MTVNRNTIPTLIENREEFTNTSGTLRAVLHPGSTLIRRILADESIEKVERDKLRLDTDNWGIAYIILSYETPIAWETDAGHVYKTLAPMSQTSERHKGLLYLLHEED